MHDSSSKPPGLPDHLEDSLYDILLGQSPAGDEPPAPLLGGAAKIEQDQAIETLCLDNSRYAEQIRALATEFRSGDRALSSSLVIPAEKGDPSVVGPYQILSRLGEGGFGVVYLAEQQEPIRRQVALKLILPGRDSRQVLARFEAERQTLALMDHEFIARVFDAGVSSDQRPFFAMEFVQGVAVTHYCDKGSLPVDARLELFIKICEGVQHAHQKGIVHRDIKPSNVLVHAQDGRSVPKIIDFGIAKAMDQRLIESSMETVVGHIVGTPAYMSPEQADPSVLDIDTRTDIYSLGVLLYELLVGDRPFDRSPSNSKSPGEILRMIREVDPPRPSQVSADLPRDLDWVVLKALAKEREERYSTASEFAADLRRFLLHEPVLAGPPSVTYRMRKFVRRYRAQVVAGAAMLGALVIVLISTIWALIEVDSARSLAVARSDELDLARKEALSLAYSADLAAAQAALESGNGESARRRLHAVPDGLRGWEHDYLLAQCDHSLALLASAGVQTDAIRESRRGVRDLAVTRDGDHLVATAYDGRIEIWDLQRREVCATVKGDGQHRLVALDPNRHQFATASETGRVELWSLPAGKLLTTLADGEGLYSIAYSPTGQLVFGSKSGIIRVVAPDTTGHSFELREHESNVTALSFSVDGKNLVSADSTGHVIMWSMARQEVTRRLETGFEVFSVRCSPDGQYVAAAGRNGAVVVWNRASGVQLWKATYDLVMLGLRFVEDGKMLLGVGGYGRSMVTGWETQTGKRIATWNGHDLGVEAIALVQHGPRFFTGSRDGTIREWSLKIPSAATTSHNRTVHLCFALAPKSNLVATGTQEGIVTVKKPGLGETLWSHDLKNAVRDLVFHPSTRQLYAITSSGRCVVLDAITGEKLSSREFGHEAPFETITIDRLGSRIALTDTVGAVYLSDTKTLENTIKLPPCGEGTTVTFHPLTNILAVCSPAGRIQFIEPSTGDALDEFQAGAPTLDCQFSPDGEVLACAGVDGIVRLIEFESRRLRLELKAGGSYIFGCAFSPSGERIVTTNMDGTVRVWNTASGLELLVLDGETDHLVFDSTGSRLYGSSSDPHARESTLYLWTANRKDL